MGNDVQYGWKCPSCGAVMAPWKYSCINCSGSKQSPSPGISWTGPNWWQNGQITCKAQDITISDSTNSNTISNTYTSINNTTDTSLNSILKSKGI